MFDVDNVRLAESQFGFCYPEEFMAIIADLIAIVGTPAFAAAFSKTRLVSPTELPKAWAEDCPQYLVPFMVTGEPGHTGYDYYCFQRCWYGSGLPLVVQTWDAIVYQWASYGDFLGWIRQQCAAKSGGQSASL
jgi:hypothetical protein